MPQRTPKQQLAVFMARYDAAIVRVAKASIAKLEASIPNATILVYDNYNALVVAFAGSPKMADVICSIALYPKWVTLFFMRGANLADPEGLLEGSGKQVRGIRLVDGAAMLDRPAVKNLLATATSLATFPPDAKRAMEIRAVVAKQRPRKPAR